MSTPTERVQEFIRQFVRLRDTGGIIHVVHTDPEADEARLTLGDLDTVLGMAYRYETLP